MAYDPVLRLSLLTIKNRLSDIYRVLLSLVSHYGSKRSLHCFQTTFLFDFPLKLSFLLDVLFPKKHDFFVLMPFQKNPDSTQPAKYLFRQKCFRNRNEWSRANGFVCCLQFHSLILIFMPVGLVRWSCAPNSPNDLWYKIHYLKQQQMLFPKMFYLYRVA